MNELEVVAVLLNAIQTHVKAPKVVKDACMALASMVEPDGKFLHVISYFFMVIHIDS